jgi:hypothetical protein
MQSFTRYNTRLIAYNPNASKKNCGKISHQIYIALTGRQHDKNHTYFNPFSKHTLF